jgi:hypothetical protein
VVKPNLPHYPEAEPLNYNRLVSTPDLITGEVVIVRLGVGEVKQSEPGSTSTCRRRSGGFVFGALMVFWALSRPIVPTPEASRGEGSTVRGAPAT